MSKVAPKYFNPGGPFLYTGTPLYELSLAKRKSWHKGFKDGLQNPLHSVCNGWLSEHGSIE